MKRRIFAWIGIIFIPLMFLISLILSIVDSPIAPTFLMVTIILTVVLPGGIYLLTKYPKDLAEIFHTIRGEGKEEKDGNEKKHK